jgi:hypothetical protein
MLDPATVQILFADLQPPIVARSKTNPPQSLTRAACVLAQCARLLGLPVHHSVVPEGGKAPEVLPDLAKETEGAPQFARMTADPFLDPSATTRCWRSRTSSTADSGTCSRSLRRSPVEAPSPRCKR